MNLDLRAGFDLDYPFPTSRIHTINGEIITHGERTIIKRRLCGWESISQILRLP